MFDTALNFGATKLSPLGSFANLFIAKADATGTFQWAKAIGGNFRANGQIRVDQNGNIYVGALGFDTLEFGGISSDNPGGSPFVVKYSPEGIVQWVVRPNGTGGTFADIAVDRLGDVIFTGSFAGELRFPSLTLTNAAAVSSPLPFLARIDTAGTLEWARAFTASGPAFTRAIALTADDECFLATDFSGTYLESATLDSAQGSGAILRFDAAGNYLGSNQCGGTSATLNDVVVDPEGKIIIAGRFLGSGLFGASLRNRQGGAMFLAKLGTNSPPQIVRSPASLTVEVGEVASLSTVASGTGLLKCQWFRTQLQNGMTNEIAIAGATNFTLQFTSAKPADTAVYWAEISDDAGSVLSGRASLQVGRPPGILLEPVGATKPIGSSIELSVIADGTAPLRYQWYRDFFGPLPGQTNASLTLSNLLPSILGNYYVIITNSAGRAVSASARVHPYSPEASFVPVPVTGWNRDVVLENSAAPAAQSFDYARSVTWFEAGLGQRFDGLPQNRVLSSAAHSNIFFQLQPYDAPNVFWMSDVKSNRTAELRVETATRFQGLAFLGATVADAAPVRPVVYLHFADGTSSPPLPLTIYDWWATAQTNTLAIAGMSYAQQSGTRFTLIRSNVRYGLGLYQARLDLTALGLETRYLSSMTFSNAVSYVPGVGIFAVSGQTPDSPAPFLVEPPSAGRVFAGEEASLEAKVSGGDLNYQWWRGEVLLTGQTERILSISNATAEDAAVYRVVVSSPTGSITVGPIPFEVILPTQPELIVGRSENGWLSISVSSQSGRVYILESSPDLVTWTPYRVFIGAGTPTSFVETQALFQSQRYFRCSSE